MVIVKLNNVFRLQQFPVTSKNEESKKCCLLFPPKTLAYFLYTDSILRSEDFSTPNAIMEYNARALISVPRCVPDEDGRPYICRLSEVTFFWGGVEGNVIVLYKYEFYSLKFSFLQCFFSNIFIYSAKTYTTQFHAPNGLHHKLVSRLDDRFELASTSSLKATRILVELRFSSFVIKDESHSTSIMLLPNLLRSGDLYRS